jgi:hypothetical protein
MASIKHGLREFQDLMRNRLSRVSSTYLAVNLADIAKHFGVIEAQKYGNIKIFVPVDSSIMQSLEDKLRVAEENLQQKGLVQLYTGILIPAETALEADLPTLPYKPAGPRTVCYVDNESQLKYIMSAIKK